MPGRPTFEQLVAEGAAVPLDGWDFSWFEGRATEERPPWGYARLLGRRLPGAEAVLDVQTGGGEVLAEALAQAAPPPGTVAATESWPPNLALATERLEPFGGAVHEAADDAELPFPDEGFDLVVSRHPTIVLWEEVARVLRPGGTYLSQQVGAGSNHELTDALMGPQPIDPRRSPQRAGAAAEAAGLRVLDLQQASLRVEFFDIAAVVHFLRKVLWTVPGFTVERYHDRLATLHDHIERTGRFVAHSRRFLIETVKPT